MGRITGLLPEEIKAPLKRLRAKLKAVYYSGKGRDCPVCGKSSRAFAAFGDPPRTEAQCTHCLALERHRFLWLYFTEKTDLFDGSAKQVLHVAPEECFAQRFKNVLGDGYTTADLMNPKAMVKMDITDIQYPDDSFDVVYCSHVLEHVPDDRKAMCEFNRVLKTDGWAILLVPIQADETFEDPSITSPEERRQAFGQADHVRIYGPDYVDRLRGAGFNVEVIKVDDIVEDADRVRLGLAGDPGEIFFCTKAGGV